MYRVCSPAGISNRTVPSERTLGIRSIWLTSASLVRPPGIPGTAAISGTRMQPSNV